MQFSRKKTTSLPRFFALSCFALTLSFGFPVLAEPSARELFESSDPDDYIKNTRVGYISTICAIADGTGLNAKTMSLLSKPSPSSKFPSYLRKGEINSSVHLYLKGFPANCNDLVSNNSFKRLQREVMGRTPSKDQVLKFFWYGFGGLAAACVADEYNGNKNIVPNVYRALAKGADNLLADEDSSFVKLHLKHFVTQKYDACSNYRIFLDS